MNISSKEKRQIGTFLVVWALIAIAGVVFFWGQNPERLLRDVTTHAQIADLRDEVEATLFAQTLTVLNGGEGGEMPQQLGAFPVDQEVRDGWPKTLEQIKRDSDAALKINLGEGVDLKEVNGSYKFSSTDDPSALFMTEPKNNIGVDTCVVWEYNFTTSDAGKKANPDGWHEGGTNMMNCIDMVIDRETRSITEVRSGNSW